MPRKKKESNNIVITQTIIYKGIRYNNVSEIPKEHEDAIREQLAKVAKRKK